MARHLRTWLVVPVVSALSLAAGYAVPRPEKKGGDMLDAVAAVQRRCPLFLRRTSWASRVIDPWGHDSIRQRTKPW
jgi:hypothetical protein